jgi:AcrR family transcriptional regulator
MNNEASKSRATSTTQSPRRRQRLVLEEIVEAAARLADRDGLSAVRMSQVANELGRNHSSLYNHVESMEALHREIALRTTADLADALTAAAIGRSGRDAVFAVAHAYRRYVGAHRGRFEAAYTIRFSDDPELSAVFQRASAIIEAALRSFGHDRDATFRAHLAISAAIRGFVIGEAQIAEAESDPDAAFDDMIELFVAGLGEGGWHGAKR